MKIVVKKLLIFIHSIFTHPLLFYSNLPLITTTSNFLLSTLMNFFVEREFHLEFFIFFILSFVEGIFPHLKIGIEISTYILAYIGKPTLRRATTIPTLRCVYIWVSTRCILLYILWLLKIIKISTLLKCKHAYI